MIIYKQISVIIRVPCQLFRSIADYHNPHIESFDGSFRGECLNMNWFTSLEDARDKIECWRRDCNEFRPHSTTWLLRSGKFAECWTQCPFDIDSVFAIAYEHFVIDSVSTNPTLPRGIVSVAQVDPVDHDRRAGRGSCAQEDRCAYP